VNNDKTFQESKKMQGAMRVSWFVSVILICFLSSSVLGAPAVNAEVLQSVVLVFGGAFTLAWPAAIGGQAAVDVASASGARDAAREALSARAGSRRVPVAPPPMPPRAR